MHLDTYMSYSQILIALRSSNNPLRHCFSKGVVPRSFEACKLKVFIIRHHQFSCRPTYLATRELCDHVSSILLTSVLPMTPDGMRFLPFAARFCARQPVPRASIRSVANLGRWHSTHALPRTVARNSGRASRQNGRVILKAAASGALLGTAAFIQLSEKNNDGTEQTAERRMLQASRDELEKTVDEDKKGLSRFAQEVIIFLDVYIWEPICTGARFCQLVVIFVPVILSVPAVWFGRRQPGRDNERSGTLWWYNFLVWAMEVAGPAFIKVKGGSSALRFPPLRWLS